MQILTLVAAAIASLLAVLAYRDAQSALSAKRPWVNIAQKDGLVTREPFTVKDGSARIVIEIRSKNGGDSAAAGTNLFWRKLVMGTAPKNIELVADVMKENCDPGNLNNQAETGELILPGEEVSLGEYSFATTATAIGPAWLIGCIG
jgi:hypothetical protein